MADGSLPSYLALAKPNPAENRGPWYANAAPAYAGLFVWIAFYNALGEALPLGGLGAALVGLVVAAVVSYLLFFKVFGTLGMKTGLPLYVVGSSTFGTKGGYLFPGIFMGLLQIGWYSVSCYFAADLVLRALGRDPVSMYGPGTQGFDAVFVITVVVWGYLFATIGAFGIKYVAKVSSVLPLIALAMMIIAAGSAFSGVKDFTPTPAEGQSLSFLVGMCMVVQMVVGFFATAGAAGVDYCSVSRNESDVRLSGCMGISLPIIIAGFLALITVAGANGTDPTLGKFGFTGALPVALPKLDKLMFLLLAVGSMAPACFCANIIGNSLSTMIPSLPRLPLTLAGSTIGIVLAALGVAGNLGPFFGLIGASFGPICGAMVADYLLSGRKWAGPREGVSAAGYAAWVVGFAVGILNNPLVGQLPGWHPTSVYSFVVGFVVYAVLAKAGLAGRSVPFGEAQAAEG